MQGTKAIAKTKVWRDRALPSPASPSTPPLFPSSSHAQLKVTLSGSEKVLTMERLRATFFSNMLGLPDVEVCSGRPSRGTFLLAG